MERKTHYKFLNTDRIIETVGRLRNRLQRRFPDSSLNELCQELLVVSKLAQERANEIRKPFIWLRVTSGLLIITFGVIFFAILGGVKESSPDEKFGYPEFIQTLEAGINDVVLIGAGLFFLFTIETRLKRKRALEAIHELRSFAHIIDMHQLTKDPVYVVTKGHVASRDQDRPMTPFQLSRYLDYCSEMLSLCGKISAVYIQEFSDSVAIAAVNEVESLTTGLSRKIWQKMMILESQVTRPLGDQEEGVTPMIISEFQEVAASYREIENPKSPFRNS